MKKLLLVNLECNNLLFYYLSVIVSTFKIMSLELTFKIYVSSLISELQMFVSYGTVSLVLKSLHHLLQFDLPFCLTFCYNHSKFIHSNDPENFLCILSEILSPKILLQNLSCIKRLEGKLFSFSLSRLE